MTETNDLREPTDRDLALLMDAAVAACEGIVTMLDRIQQQEGGGLSASTARVQMVPDFTALVRMHLDLMNHLAFGGVITNEMRQWLNTDRPPYGS